MSGKKIVFSTVGLGILCWGMMACAVLAQDGVLQLTKSAAPSEIWPEDCQVAPNRATVTLEVRKPPCDTLRGVVDLMLVIDRSQSMDGEDLPLSDAKAAAKALLDFLGEPAPGNFDRAGLVAFNQIAETRLNLRDMDGDGKEALRGKIDALYPDGRTNIGDGIRKAANRLIQKGRGVPRAAVLLTHGMPNKPDGVDPYQYTRDGADYAAANGIKIFAVGFYPGPTEQELLEYVATVTDGKYYSFQSPDDLQGIVEDIAAQFICPSALDATIAEVLPDYVHQWDGFSIVPDSIFSGIDGTTTILWYVDEIRFEETWEASLLIGSDSTGADLPVDVEGASKVTYMLRGEAEEQPFPQAYVTVGGCAPVIEVQKVGTDINGGDLEPGDVIEYEVTIANTGNKGATGLRFTDPRPEDTHQLVIVDIPSGADDYSTDDMIDIRGIDVDFGGSVAITFRVTVKDPAAADAEEICNQGWVRNIPDAPDEPTDDPSTETEDDPTCMPLEAAPVIEVYKADAEVNGGGVEPGDVIEYEVTIVNEGNQDAEGLSFTDTIPEYTGYMSSSLTTTSGTLMNEDPVEISGIYLPVGDTVIIVFRVRVDASVEAGVEEICNQGWVSNIPGTPDEPTDDPDTREFNDDPTCTPLVAAPVIEVWKVDKDIDGHVLEPGDVIHRGGEIVYEVTIVNNDNQDAEDLRFT
ncbi:MAG: VWA domain-containing protein, partial [bacterium]